MARLGASTATHSTVLVPWSLRTSPYPAAAASTPSSSNEKSFPVLSGSKVQISKSGLLCMFLFKRRYWFGWPSLTFHWQFTCFQHLFLNPLFSGPECLHTWGSDLILLLAFDIIQELSRFLASSGLSSCRQQPSMTSMYILICGSRPSFFLFFSSKAVLQPGCLGCTCLSPGLYLFL